MAEAAEIHSYAPAANAGVPPVIEPVGSAVTAFIGRTLRGPLHQPTRVDSFADFQRQFGGLWQPSMLGYAVAQFFDNGGQCGLIVRVANGARAPTVTLPGPGGGLRLRGVNPGTREFLRAAVDYDGIPPEETQRFNLVVQRLQLPGTELIEEQETFRRISVDAEGDRGLAGALAASRLVRIDGPLPTLRPQATAGFELGPASGYVPSAADGDDGGAISDYDLIGSGDDLTGLAALQACGQHFSLLCIPPLSRDQDVGLATWMVASRLCRRRQALLIVDPPREWDSAETALRALPDWSFHSTDACMFFPRIALHDRLRGRSEVFAPGGTVAGMIAAADARVPLWSAASGTESLVRAPAQLAGPVSDGQRQRLAGHGVNTLRAVRSAASAAPEQRTLVPDVAARPELRLLQVRRLAHCIVASIVQGTRWALLEPVSKDLWQRLRAQVEAFLESFAQHGALVGDRTEDSWFVICDERLNAAAGELRLLFGFAPVRPAEFLAYLVVHRAGGSSVRAVSVNRAATHRVDAVLQGLLMSAAP